MSERCRRFVLFFCIQAVSVHLKTSVLNRNESDDNIKCYLVLCTFFFFFCTFLMPIFYCHAFVHFKLKLHIAIKFSLSFEIIFTTKTLVIIYIFTFSFYKSFLYVFFGSFKPKLITELTKFSSLPIFPNHLFKKKKRRRGFMTLIFTFPVHVVAHCTRYEHKCMPKYACTYTQH